MTPPETPTPTPGLSVPFRSLNLSAVAASCAVFAWQLYQLVDRHAVNVLFSDQWDFLGPLRQHASQWQLFSLQHGPHRMGLGYLFIEAVYRLTGWNTRAEAFATVGLYLVIVALALWLKTRIAGPLTWLDACIPALILSRTQFEVFVGTPDAAHGPIPLLLAVTAPFCWELRSAPLRALAGGALAFAAAFTGFALLLVPCIAALFVIDAVRGDRWALAGAALCGASIAAFLHGYRFGGSAVACYRFPDAHPFEYLPFTGLVLLRPMRVGHLIPGALAAGSLAALCALAFAAFALVRVLRRSPLDRAVFLWTGFALLFATSSAVGRVCLGLDAAFASRYVPYALPLWLAAYFVYAARPRPLWLSLAGGLALVLLQGTVHSSAPSVRWFSEGKTAWRACYRATLDEAGCNRSTGFRVYPEEGAPNVRAMLDWLRANRLNLFQEPAQR